MENDEFFYWACAVLDSKRLTCREIAIFLVERGYNCGKSTVDDAILRFKTTGSPLPLKRGRPRESGIRIE